MLSGVMSAGPDKLYLKKRKKEEEKRENKEGSGEERGVGEGMIAVRE